MASTLWYRTDLDLDAARETLQQAMKSLGVTRFYPPEERFTGTDDPMETHRRLPNWSAQLSNFGVGRQGQMPKDSYVHLRLYAESTGTTVASGVGIYPSFLGIFFSIEEKKENQFHEIFSQAWQALDSSITPIEHPGYLM